MSIVGAKNNIEKINKALKTSISEYLVFFRAESKALLKSGDWQNLKTKAKSKVGANMMSLHEVPNDLKIELASFAEDRENLKWMFVNFFTSNTVWAERIALPQGKMQILCSQFDQDLKSIPEKIGSKKASIEASQDVARMGLIIKGNQADLKKIRSCVDDILGQLHLHQETISGAAARAFKQEAWKYFCWSLEKNSNVYVGSPPPLCANWSRTCSMIAPTFS